jgi:hypothetical protein
MDFENEVAYPADWAGKLTIDIGPFVNQHVGLDAHVDPDALNGFTNHFEVSKVKGVGGAGHGGAWPEMQRAARPRSFAASTFSFSVL